MTDEELDVLIQEASDKFDAFTDDPEKPLTKKEKNRKLVIQLQIETLKRIKAAKEKNNLQQEVKASLDYSLLTQYGEKHPFWMSYIKAHMGWWWGI